MKAFLLPGDSTVPWPAMRIRTVSFFVARPLRNVWKALRIAAVVAFSSVGARTFSGGKPAAARAEHVLLESRGVGVGKLQPLVLGQPLILGDADEQRVGLASGGSGGCRGGGVSASVSDSSKILPLTQTASFH